MTVTAKAVKLLNELQAVDFTLTELSLYLDTHPDDQEALKQFNETGEKRKALKTEVEEQLGSLCKNEPFTAGKPGGWDEGPWPWQI